MFLERRFEDNGIIDAYNARIPFEITKDHAESPLKRSLYFDQTELHPLETVPVDLVREGVFPVRVLNAHFPVPVLCVKVVEDVRVAQ